MSMKNWLRPGINVKRWIALGILGVLALSAGFGGSLTYTLNRPLYLIFFLTLIVTGIIVIYISFKFGMKSILRVINSAGIYMSMDEKKLSNLICEKRLLIKGPKIVVIGGGTGLSTMLRGLKYYTSNITAIVTVADDGGGSGVLRETLGILPPGDIRNCILALADTEPVMEELLQYRFTEGMLKGQSFGNLFLAAMNGISGSFEEAIKKMSDVLAVTGSVLPVTLADITLCAELENGFIIEGESKITKRDKYRDVPIKRVFINPDKVLPLKEAISAIDEADAIILGPGSLYTSIIPNLLVDDIVNHIKDSNSIKIYVSNIMTQPGETDGYSVFDHIKAIERHSTSDIIDYVIVNNGKIPVWLYKKYTDDGAKEVEIDRDKISAHGVDIIENNFVYTYKDLIRHDSRKLAQIIMELIINKKLMKDKKRSLEIYYMNERMKEMDM